MKRVRCLLGSGFDAMKTWEEWKRKRLFTNETPMFSYNSLLFYSELVLWLKYSLRNAMNSTQWVVAEMRFMVNSSFIVNHKELFAWTHCAVHSSVLQSFNA